MALYPICQTSIHNIEIYHGCFTILIVYQSMLSSFMSYAKVLVRPDDPGTDRGSLCFRAFSSVLLIHPKGGGPGGTRVVTSYTSVMVTALSVWRNSGVAFSVLPYVRVRCRSSWKEVKGTYVLRYGTFSLLSYFLGTCSPYHDLT